VIRFSLSCAQDHPFEGWFRDNATFEQQASAGQIACPTCGDTAVRKAIMAPAVARTDTTAAAERAQKRMAVMMQVMRQVRQHVETNFENVGPKFAEEARRIHHGESEKRDIWGQATPDEAKELREEGVPVAPLPEVPELDG
jgi:hypothetical protein